MKTVWRFIDWTCMTLASVCSCILTFVSDAKIAWACCTIWCVKSMCNTWKIDHPES